jgi:hypothetical protein
VTPPERLRIELQRFRDQGYPFGKAWPAAIAHAIEDETDDTAIFWAETWIEQQRCSWEASYNRVASRRHALSFSAQLEDDFSEFAGRSRPQMVAA